ncbi:facilitated trehalose transporter Tret1-2 homolog isoform X2 [Zootermopsis nevadensis]|uniref:facilitated trehalose transporter Tret1-2 homolog isoform X2 n=1 Tax=Zootermopsis nevadensis TaxID=136037 RepID=UPI000B8E70A1|nr:facilitated trehalose transporter Tret1-2 homolog isoform X2 [Zootermopsis nevadensis]
MFRAKMESSVSTLGHDPQDDPREFFILKKDTCDRLTPCCCVFAASIAALPMAPGCVLGGLLMERLGRRAAHQVVCVPHILGWVLISVARNVPAIYVGRFLTGLCLGMNGPLSPVFIAETSGPEFRGVLLAMVSLAVAIGILVGNFLGTVLSWQLAAAISAVFPLVCYVGVFWVPESPVWLAARGRHAEATAAFRWYRGCSADVVKELTDLLGKHAAERPRQTWADLWGEVCKMSFLKPFFVMIVFFLVMQCSGVNAVSFYTVSILDGVGSGMDSYVATNVIGLVRVVVSAVGCILTRRFGRRPLAVISCLGAGASLLGLGAAGPGWVPLLLLMVYIFFMGIGLVPLPWVMVGEVFPAAARGLGSGCSSCFCFVVFFAVVKTLPALAATVGIHGAFYAYGAVALGGAVFLYAFLPETRNRTLQDIEDGYSRANNNNNNRLA